MDRVPLLLAEQLRQLVAKPEKSVDNVSKCHQRAGYPNAPAPTTQPRSLLLVAVRTRSAPYSFIFRIGRGVAPGPSTAHIGHRSRDHRACRAQGCGSVNMQRGLDHVRGGFGDLLVAGS